MSLHVIEGLVQGTEEWFAARRGMVTASVVGKLLTVTAPGALEYACPECDAVPIESCISLSRKSPSVIKVPHSGRAKVAADNAATAKPIIKVADNDTSRAVTLTLVAERLSGFTDPSYVNDDMMRGILHEPVARDRYAEHNKVEVRQVGFMVRDDLGGQLGASPDGLVSTDGGIEVKCPRAKEHIRTIIADEVPVQYMPQVQACLLVSGREWWDFVSFCAGLPMYTKRVYPDPVWQNAITDAARAFEKRADRIVDDYLTKSAGLPATERIADDLEMVI